MTTNPRPPKVLRDLPLGAQGLRGRLLILSCDMRGRVQVVFYRGVNKRAKVRVANCAVEGLKAAFEGSQEIERRIGKADDLHSAIAIAVDLPAPDIDVLAIMRYLEATPRAEPETPISDPYDIPF